MVSHCLICHFRSFGCGCVSTPQLFYISQSVTHAQSRCSLGYGENADDWHNINACRWPELDGITVKINAGGTRCNWWFRLKHNAYRKAVSYIKRLSTCYDINYSTLARCGHGRNLGIDTPPTARAWWHGIRVCVCTAQTLRIHIFRGKFIYSQLTSSTYQEMQPVLKQPLVAM